MKSKLILLTVCLVTCLAASLAWRGTTPVEAQAGATCATGTAPAVTYGFTRTAAFPQGDIFALPTGVSFTITDPASTALFFSPNNTNFGGNPSLPGQTALGLGFATPNGSVTALSCADSFWDINLVISRLGATDGDVVRLFMQKADGTGLITLVTFTVTGGNLLVTGLDTSVMLSANGHVPAGVGTIIPFGVSAGAAGMRTDLITLALSMSPTAGTMGCLQLGIQVNRGAGVGTTAVGLASLVMIRNQQAGDAARPDLGVFGGLTGGFPTGLPCAAACPVCPAIQGPVCDKYICFRRPEDYCVSIPTILRGQTVSILGYNYGVPVPVFIGGLNGSTTNPYLDVALGCGGFMRMDPYSQLNRLYVAAQLSIMRNQTVNIDRLQIGCFMMPMMMPGMPAMPAPLPVTLSNGVTLTPLSSFGDLYTQTKIAFNAGRIDDINALIKLYSLLRCRD